MKFKQLTKLPPNAKVGVVGGGISGLFFTYYLSKLRPDVNITLIDQNQGRLGGWIYSWNTQDKQGKDVMLERGPRTLRGISDGTVLMIDAIKKLGHSDKVSCIEEQSPANRKFLLGPNNALVQVPDSWVTFCKFYASPLAKGLTKSVLFEWARPKKKDYKDESVEQLIKRRFGSNLLGQNIMSAIYHGIYADDISTLSAKRVAANLFCDEQKYGSTLKAALMKLLHQRGSQKFNSEELSPVLQAYQSNFHGNAHEIFQLSKKLKNYPMLSFEGGLSVVPNSITSAIKDMPNVSILNKRVTQLISKDKELQLAFSNNNSDIGSEKFDHVRFSLVPNYIQNIFSEENNRELIRKLQKIKYNTVLLVNFYHPTKDIITTKYDSFGYLVPKSNSNPEHLLGVIFDSVIEKNRKPLFPTSTNGNHSNENKNYTKLTAMVGGHLLNDLQGNPIVPDKNTVIDQVKNALKKHLHVSDKDLNDGLWVYTAANDCLPRFNVGFNELADEIENQVIKQYNGNVSFGGMAFSKGPGIPDVVVDSMLDAIKLK
ncbi:oxygen-dependent protoporphyrinogen oxidase PWA37_003049 [Arxiozyma heterogenica]|uniref:oxygen-dependent protoporphyrinogen oxidase n=1 Tax=Arxiozyma heterogenica TaxID=278026 RepID=UPI002F033613